MEIVTSLLSFTGQVVKYTFWTGVVVTGGVALIASNTKPSDASFDEMIRREYKQQLSDTVPAIVKNVAAYVNTVTVDTEVKDYVLFKVGIFGHPVKAGYIGVFNNWFLVV